MADMKEFWIEIDKWSEDIKWQWHLYERKLGCLCQSTRDWDRKSEAKRDATRFAALIPGCKVEVRE